MENGGGLARILDPGSWILDPRSRILDGIARTKLKRGPRYERGARTSKEDEEKEAVCVTSASRSPSPSRLGPPTTQSSDRRTATGCRR